MTIRTVLSWLSLPLPGMEPVLLTATADRVVTLTLNRPEARNALNVELMTALVDAFHAAEADDDVAAVVLTGAGKAFCAGLDLREVGAQGIDPDFVLDPERSPW